MNVKAFILALISIVLFIVFGYLLFTNPIVISVVVLLVFIAVVLFAMFVLYDVFNHLL